MKRESTDGDYYFEKLYEKGILFNIFKSITSRRPLSLVNKLFYKAVCQVDNYEDFYRGRFEQDFVVIEDENNEQNVLESVYHSKRVLTEVYIHQIYFVDIIGYTYKENFLKSFIIFTKVLKSKMTSVLKLTIDSCLMTENQLMYILDGFHEKSLVELNIINSAIIYENIRTFPGILAFPNLKKLDLSGTSYGNPDSNVPIHPNCAMHVFLKSISENSSRLNNLSVRDHLARMLKISNFQLTRICIQKATPMNVRLCDIVCQQVGLTSIDFLDSFMMEDVLNEILHLPTIKSVKINVDGISLNGFVNICRKRSLEELGLKCSDSSIWIVNALSMSNINFLEKFYLDIAELNVSFVGLCQMLNKNVKDIHLIASQCYAVECLFLSTFISRIEKITIELNINKFKYTNLLTDRHYNPAFELKEFTLINRSLQHMDFICDLDFVLDQSFLIRKIRVEGIEVTKDLFTSAIKNHILLEELYLIKPKRSTCDFVFDRSYAEMLQHYGRNLKIMQISCSKSKLKSSKQLPFIIRRGGDKIFRYR